MIPTIFDANEMLKGLIERDRQTSKVLKRPEALYSHCKCVSNIAYSISCVLLHKGYNIDPLLAQVGGLLDDVGKCVYTPDLIKKDPGLEFDSIVGANYLENVGYGEVAKVIRPSFVTKEILELKPDVFPDIKPEDLLLETNVQKAVVIGDVHSNGIGEIVSLKERISDIKNRYPSDSLLVRALEEKGGKLRLRNLNKEMKNATGLL